MTRNDFSTEFIRCMRYVIQKQDRVNAALRVLQEDGSRPVREANYAAAQTNLDGALVQLADHMYDALEAMKLSAIEP